MRSPTLLILESDGRWAAAFRAEGVDSLLALRELRSFSECQQALQQSPRAIVAFAATAKSFERVLQQIQTTREVYPRSITIALCDRELTHYERGESDLVDNEFVVRQCGATHVLFSPRAVHGLLESLKRYVSQFPPRPLTAETIWSNLPWSDE